MFYSNFCFVFFSQCDKLRTVLCQVMDIVNSRPLTHMPEGEVVELITPNHFLRLRGEHVNTFLESNISDVSSISSADKLLTGYKEIERIVRDFRVTFFNLYFSMLKEKHMLSPTHRHPRGSYPYKPQVGDVVLVQIGIMPRSTWPYGVIVALDE